MSRTYAHQKLLPKLPIPELEHSKQALLTALKPLLTAAQFSASKQQIHDFFDLSGSAQKLHTKLLLLDAELSDSWLKPFWDDAYLVGRAPLHTATNFALQLDKQRWHQRLDTTAMAARLLQAATVFYQGLRQEKIAPETMRGVALDMSQYAGFMASKRIPHHGKDYMYQAELDKQPLHMCIALRGHVFSLQTTDTQGVPHSRKALEISIRELMNEVTTDGPDVGLHTISERDQAAQFYTRLSYNPVNNHNLSRIADALFLLVLDESSQNQQQALHSLLLDGHNKWFDKPLQLVLGKDADLGVNIEHTDIDGTTCLAIISQLLDCTLDSAEPKTSTQQPPLAQRLDWQLDKQQLAELSNLQQQNTDILASYWLHTEHFTNFGAEQIKQLGFSPDAFFHMALQVAQLQTFGHMRSTYESVAMRTYYQGRTDCLRPSNAENLALATAVQQKASEQDIYQLMQQASQTHSKKMRLVQKGQGFERHLYGLHQVYERYGKSLGLNELPELFADSGYQILSHDFISTSNMTSPLVQSCAFAPVANDGFGIFYLLLDDKISINLSSHSHNKQQAKQLLANMLLAFEQLRATAITANRI